MLNPSQFKLDDKDHLFVRTDKGEVQITHKKDPPKFKQLRTLQGEMGVSGVRRYLSLSELSVSNLESKGLNSQTIQVLETVKDNLPSDRDIEMTELKKTARDSKCCKKYHFHH